MLLSGPGACASDLRFACPFGSWLQGPGVNLQRAATNETRAACPSFRFAVGRKERGIMRARPVVIGILGNLKKCNEAEVGRNATSFGATSLWTCLHFIGG